MIDKCRDDQPSKPNAGVVKVHGEKKFEGRDDTPSAPSHGGVAHPEKQNGRNRVEPISKPSHGGVVRPQKRSTGEPVSNPQGDGGSAIPKERLHLDKVKADASKESR